MTEQSKKIEPQTTKESSTTSKTALQHGAIDEFGIITLDPNKMGEMINEFLQDVARNNNGSIFGESLANDKK